MTLEFTKMHGLGNDFVVIDATTMPFTLSSAEIQQMANRRLGVGFDQLLVIERCDPSLADFRFRIFNADGTEVEQCGNGARCVALFLKHKKLCENKQIRVLTLGGVLTLSHQKDGKVAVNMGIPRFLPDDIPFLVDQPAKSYLLALQTNDKQSDRQIKLSVVNVGNPHAVILVDHIDSIDVSDLGETISRHAQFPHGVNVGFMQIIDTQHIRLRVYERGAGQTLACGSGACAAMVVGRRNGWLQERVMVNQPGGSLWIDWAGPDASITMTGPATMVFTGVWFF